MRGLALTEGVVKIESADEESADGESAGSSPCGNENVPPVPENGMDARAYFADSLSQERSSRDPLDLFSFREPLQPLPDMNFSLATFTPSESSMRSSSADEREAPPVANVTLDRYMPTPDHFSPDYSYSPHTPQDFPPMDIPSDTGSIISIDSQTSQDED